MPSRTARTTTLAPSRRPAAWLAVIATLAAATSASAERIPTTPSVAPLGSAPAGSEVIVASDQDDSSKVLNASYGAPLAAGGYVVDGPPVAAIGGGSYYNPTLGSHIRARYNTRSYAQEEGTFDIGTMRLMELDGGFAFLDGQVTLNDESRVGYNLGAGYRWLTLPMFPFSPDDQKIMGVSVWSDGQTFGAERFVPQVGVSFEMLGDRIDFRANGYTPLGPTTRTRDFAPSGELGFFQNFVGNQFIGVQDTLLTVGEMELAGRLGNLDAWAFGGVYGFRGGAYEEVGGELGLRGYATPDVLLSIAVTNDDLFDTRAVFNATWFIGRTRAENCPTGVLTDRFREPVLRNQYIASMQDTVVGARNALRDPDNELIRVVHVNSGAGAGGDGTFENPYDNLSDVNMGAEMEGDIVLVHAGTTYSNDSITLLDDQRLLGEGFYDNGNMAIANTAIRHTIATNTNGVVELPETFDGAFDTAAPVITNGAGFDAVTMADNNEVNNLEINGGNSAITSDMFDAAGLAGGAGDPTLQNLIISGTTGDAIVLNSYLRTDTDDVDNDGDTTEQSVEFNVVIDEVQLADIGGNGIVINGEDPDGFGNNVSDDANIPLNESVDITNVTSTGGTGVGIVVQNTHEGSAVNITDYSYDGQATALGALAFMNVGGVDMNNLAQVTIDNSNFTGGSAAGTGIAIIDSAAQFTVNNNNTINNVAGTTLLVDGDGGAMEADTVTEGNVAFDANINNADGRSVVVQELTNATTAVVVNGDITDTGDGIQVTQNEAAAVTFNGAVNIDSDSAVDAVSLTDNPMGSGVNAAINFNGGLVVNTTGGGEGFVATGGGLIGVANGAVENTISSDGSAALRMEGVQVAAGGATFTRVDAANAVNGIVLDDLDGGPVQIGATNADADSVDPIDRGGTISGMTGDAVVLTNTENVTINGLLVNDPAAGQSGLAITHTPDATDADNNMTVTVNDSRVTTDTLAAAASGTGVSVTGSDETATSTFVLNINDSAVNDTNDGFLFTNVEGDVNASNTTVLDVADTGIDVQGSGGDINFLFDDTDPATIEFRAAGTAINIDGGDGGAKVFEGDIDNTAGDAVVIANTVNPGITIAGDITNSGGRTVDIRNNDGGNITFSGDLDDNMGAGIRAQDNFGDGTLNFVADVNLDTGANTAVTLQNNVTPATTTLAYDVNFTMTGAEALTIQTNGNTGFFASQGGTLSITGAGNTINTTNGVGLLLVNTDIDAADNVAFESVSASGAATGVSITDATGGSITIGEGGGADGDGGTLNTTGPAIVLTDASNVTFNDVAITGSGATAIDVNGTDDQIALATFNNVQTPAVGTAVDITQTGTGAVNVTIADSELDGSTTVGISATGVDGVVAVSDTTITGGSGQGVVIDDSDGVFTFDANVEISGKDGEALLVDDSNAGADGGDSNVTYNGTITNTAGRSVVVQNKTGGGVTFGAGSTIDDTGTGILVDNNSGGVYGFNGDTTVNTAGANNAITVTNNTGATATFANLDIDTVDGAGFTATGGGDIAVTGSDNTIDTTGAGVALNLDGVNVTGAGVAIDTVNVNGAANAVNLNDVTGGAVTVGNTTTASSATTTGAAIVVNNSANLTVRNLDINASGATSIDIDSTDATNSTVTLDDVTTPGAVAVDHTGTGNFTLNYDDSAVDAPITLNHSGAGTFAFNNTNLTVTDTGATAVGQLIDINATTGGAVNFFAENLTVNTGANVDGVNLFVGGTVNDADISLTGTSSITTLAGQALEIDIDGSAKQVRFELSSATLTNNGASDVFTLVSDAGATTTNATIGSNVFNNEITFTNGVAGTVNMSITGNDSSTADGIVLTNNNGPLNFNILGVDGPTVDAGNNNDIFYTGTDADFTFNPGLIVTPPSP